MSKINSFLTSRFKPSSDKSSKMTELAEKSSGGALSSFAGVFRVAPLAESEHNKIADLLNTFKIANQEITADLRRLTEITSEVKAINNQAALLHGERIKRAQDILKQYRDGAFSAWLVSTYGNRQTPYNFLQYFELYQQLTPSLRAKLDGMPRQAIYTLASRNASFIKKEEMIQNYNGESKQEFLSLVRKAFPLAVNDGRRENIAQQVIQHLQKLETLFADEQFRPNLAQKKAILLTLKKLLRNV